MKLYYWLIIPFAVAFTSCQNNQSTPKTEESSTSVVTQQTCYSYTKNRDTASLMMMRSGHIITGELHYQLFEKDSNKGLIKGEMRGDTIIADYIFGSEGKQSVRQVAFLEKDGKLIEGFGEVTEKDGKTIFKSISNLEFGNSITFTKINCK